MTTPVTSSDPASPASTPAAHRGQRPRQQGRRVRNVRQSYGSGARDGEPEPLGVAVPRDSHGPSMLTQRPPLRMWGHARDGYTGEDIQRRRQGKAVAEEGTSAPRRAFGPLPDDAGETPAGGRFGSRALPDDGPSPTSPASFGSGRGGRFALSPLSPEDPLDVECSTPVPPPVPVLPDSDAGLAPSAGRRYSASMEPGEVVSAAPRRSAATATSPASALEPHLPPVVRPTAPPPVTVPGPARPSAGPHRRRGFRPRTCPPRPAAGHVGAWAPGQPRPRSAPTRSRWRPHRPRRRTLRRITPPVRAHGDVRAQLLLPFAARGRPQVPRLPPHRLRTRSSPARHPGRHAFPARRRSGRRRSASRRSPSPHRRHPPSRRRLRPAPAR